MKKITFFIGTMARGGAERVISILANHYAKKGWKVEIVLLLQNTVRYELNSKITIINLSRKGSYLKNLLYWIINIRKYIVKQKPDRVVSFIGRINYLVLTSLFGINVPIIISERNDPKNDGRGVLLRFYGNICYRLATSIVFQTNYQKLCFSKQLYQKSFIVGNPIEISTTPSSYFIDSLEITNVGRLEKQKNQKLLIEAFYIINKKYPSLSLNIYGEGSLRNELQSLIDNYDLSNKVKLCGNIYNLHEKISTSKIFILTSEYEGLSNALIEAMMLGLPCIVTDYHGVDEIIKNNYNGIIVPRNDVSSLVAAIDSLLCSRDLRKNISENALSTTKKYMKTNVLKEWENIIEKY